MLQQIILVFLNIIHIAHNFLTKLLNIHICGISQQFPDSGKILLKLFEINTQILVQFSLLNI